MYKISIGRFGLKPEECLIIEDNENGLKAAYGSGAHVLKVDSVEDVNFFNIKSNIKNLENYA